MSYIGWESSIENRISVEDFMRAKKALEASKVPMSCVSLGSSTTVLPPVTAYEANKQKKEEAMYAQSKTNVAAATLTVAPATDHLADERRHLQIRLETAKYTKKDQLRDHFGLNDDQRPHNAKDFLKRIQEGKFIIPEKYLKDEDRWFDADMIRWRDPNRVEDQAGYDEAKVKMENAYNYAIDEIKIKDSIDGLAAFRDFESKTFH